MEISHMMQKLDIMDFVAYGMYRIYRLDRNTWNIRNHQIGCSMFKGGMPECLKWLQNPTPPQREEPVRYNRITASNLRWSTIETTSYGDAWRTYTRIEDVPSN